MRWPASLRRGTRAPRTLRESSASALILGRPIRSSARCLGRNPMVMVVADCRGTVGGAFALRTSKACSAQREAR
jgi:hypothetical protein